MLWQFSREAISFTGMMARSAANSGVLGQDVQIGAGVDDDDPRYPRHSQRSGKHQRTLQGMLEFAQAFDEGM